MMNAARNLFVQRRTGPMTANDHEDLAYAPCLDLPPETPEEARAMCEDLRAAMSDLLAVIEEETGHLREGHQKKARELANDKEDCADRYMQRLRSTQPHGRILASLARDDIARLRDLQGRLQAALEENLAVLSLVHDVSAGILRDVATALNRGKTTRSYGSAGQMQDAAARGGSGLALDSKA